MNGPKMVCHIVAACAAALLAQEYPEYSAAMKANAAAYGALRNLEAKTGPEAVAHAEKLGGIFENLIPFWRQRGAADAVKWSEQGKAAAVQLTSAANSADPARASEAFETLGGACRACHEKYRERLPDGRFRIREAGPR